ncbi:MAG: hypothetical protein H7066_12505 [Cytophagaceae bacterium]|nr:hypothetical protein [Gemmatimonadaceae bacterium]
MFIELVDILRCPRAHEETWLVAAVSTFHGRHIATGSLGCPICRTEYPVADGAADFTVAGHPPDLSPRLPPSPVADDEVMRARALLDLSEAGGVVAALGTAATLAAALEDSAECTILQVNPSGAATGRGVSTLWVDDRVPLAPDALRGALVGEDVSQILLASLVAAIRPKGRLVAPVGLPLPEGMSELARDDRQWVASRTGARISPPVPLQRGWSK